MVEEFKKADEINIIVPFLRGDGVKLIVRDLKK